LRVLTEDGIGKTHQGGRGRSNKTLYSTEILAPLVRGQRGRKRSQAEKDQLRLGARALTLFDSISADLEMLAEMDELWRYDVPQHQRLPLVRFFKRWLRGHFDMHLQIK